MMYSKYDLIRNPVITEKSTILEEQNKYIFKIAKDANKVTVKKAIEEIFEVKVNSVNIINIKGKIKKFKGVKGRRSDIKKAVITLKEGSTIDIAGGI
ncbi:MAG: 50S ribosomal protein L23 [Rickettsiaceae bacterium]|nr:50S ribosomal protein L23 [Rickettsiaceae bacterium]